MRKSHSIAGRIAAAALVLAGVVAGTAIVSSELASASDVARRAPRATHIGAAVSDFVILTLVDEATTPKFVRLDGEGAQSASEFVVPTGQALVITGFDVMGEFRNTYTTTAARFWIESADGGTQSIAMAHMMDTPQTTNSSAGHGYTGSATVAFQSAVVMGAGTKLLFDVIQAVKVDDAFNTEGFWAPQYNRDIHVTVRGYLTAAD
jgi:hypothetical protein